jgi:hypothetical protein
MTKDLAVLVADLDAKETVIGLLNRQKSLGIRPITFDILKHDQRDAGCYKEAHNLLRAQSRRYDYALVIFDHDGSGQEQSLAAQIQEDIEERLMRNGWDQRCRAIVIAPELEIWVWSTSRQVDVCLGWESRQPDLRTWLREKNLLAENAVKPDDPKFAFDEALAAVKKTHSSSIFRDLAGKVSLRGCVDPAFQRLHTTLTDWFPDNR